MEAWKALSKEHSEAFKRIQLLEKALLSSSKDKIQKVQINDFKSARDLLKFLGFNLRLHFKVEEEALFPALNQVSKNAGKIILELLSEHMDIRAKLAKLEAGEDRGLRDALIELPKVLPNHAKKEEAQLPPLIKTLSEEELNKIDETARSLGYSM
jgi:hemerythrin-like domain-containing protein